MLPWIGDGLLAIFRRVFVQCFIILWDAGDDVYSLGIGSDDVCLFPFEVVLIG